MYTIGDNVQVRFNLSKINGMDKFVKDAQAEKQISISDDYPIGIVQGTIVGKGDSASFKQRAPYAVVQFSKNQIVCGCYDVSRATLAVSLEEGPDWYGARIIDENGSMYTEPYATH